MNLYMNRFVFLTYAMLILCFINSIPENLLQNDYNVSCVTGVTVITGPLFITQDKRSDLPSFLKHAVEEAMTESKREN